MSLRYFVPRGAPIARDLEPPVSRVVDALTVRGRSCVVARELSGELVVVDDATVPGDLRPVVVHNEIARGKPVRSLDVEELWLLEIELLEQPGDTPGENDPLQLAGRLSGPFCNFSGGGAIATTTPGQLTVTRGDLLRGFVDGVADAFHLDGHVVLHAMVPGGPAAEIGAGRSVVLAYAVFPSDVDGGNEAAMLPVFLAAVQALKDDVAAHKPGHAFASCVVPVASRKALLDDWEAEGFVVDKSGSVAVRKGEGGFMSSVFGAAEKRAVPPEAGVADVVPLGRKALAALSPAFPDARSQQLFGRLRPGTVTPASRPLAGVPANTAGAAGGAARPVQQPYRRSSPDWMSDFAGPPATASKPTKPTKPTKPPAPAPKPVPRVTAVPPKPVPSTTKQPSPGSGKPGWMSDFE